MKAPLLLALSLAFLATSAQAKLVVGEPQPVIGISVDDTAVVTGPAGALLESNYFNAPQPMQNFGRGNSCRAPLSLLRKHGSRSPANNRNVLSENPCREIIASGRRSCDYSASVFFTSATSCLSVKGLARNAYCSWLGRFLLKASSA